MVGPSDATDAKDKCHTYGGRWVSESSHGIGAALNQGFQGATTPFLGWLGDDDVLTAGSLDVTLLALQRDPGAVMVYGRVLCVDEDGQGLFMIAPGRLGAQLMRIGHDFVPQPGCLFRRDAFMEVGGLDESLKYAMDLDLFLKLRTRGRVIYVAKVLSQFRRHEGSLTVSNPAPGQEARTVRRRHMGRLSSLIDPYVHPGVDVFGKLWAKAFLHDKRWEATQ